MQIKEILTIDLTEDIKNVIDSRRFVRGGNQI
jgi:hypothetical protein